MTRRRRTRQTVERTESRLDHLVFVRESDAYDNLLMEGMIHQTLAKVSDLPGASELQGAGMGVFEHPGRFGATQRRVGSSRLVTVEHDGVLYLFAMGTAATNDLDNDTNAIVSELIRIVAAYRPREVWVAAFTRLLRSADHVGDLLRVFSEHVERLHCEADIHPATPEGKMLFQVLAMIAATERDYIVRRHTAGRVAQWRRGEWIPNAYPPGYRLEQKHLVLDEAAVERTREMLRILADQALTTAECAARVGGLGITTPMIESLHGQGATIADARNPTEAVNTLCGWAELYRTGRYEMLWPNPFPGVSDIAGVRVEDVEGYKHGALPLPVSVELPPGGWVDDATIDAVGRRFRTSSLTGGASHKTVPPLSGLFGYEEDGFEHTLSSNQRGVYTLLRRRVTAERAFAGWAHDGGDHEPVLVASRASLHAAMAEAAIEGVKSGLPGHLDAGRFLSIGPLPPLDPHRARIRAVRRQLAEVTTALERAKRNAALAEEDDAAALFVEDTKRHHAERVRLAHELEDLEARSVDPVLGVTFESYADLVAHAMAALSHAGNSESRELRDALRAVITKERLWAEGERVCFEFSLELPHAEGTVVLGPLRGKTENRAHRDPVTERWARQRERKPKKEEFIGLGLGERAAGCLAACTDGRLGAIVLAHLKTRPVPDGIDHGFAAHIVDVYTDPTFRWDRGRWWLADQKRQAVLDALREGGGTLTLHELRARGITTNQLKHLRTETPAPSGEPIILLLRRGRNPLYGLIPCPHCGGYASLSMVTPETRPGVVCPTCWRAPKQNAPELPAWYRE